MWAGLCKVIDVPARRGLLLIDREAAEVLIVTHSAFRLRVRGWGVMAVVGRNGGQRDGSGERRGTGDGYRDTREVTGHSPLRRGRSDVRVPLERRWIGSGGGAHLASANGTAPPADRSNPH